MTSSKLAEKRKHETNQYNMQTFSNLSIGIHGKELPKFKEAQQEYWKLQANHVASPKLSTRTELLMSRRDMDNNLPIARECDSRADEDRICLRKQLSTRKITNKPGHPSQIPEYTPIDGYNTIKTIPAKHEYRPSTVFGYFLKSQTAAHNSERPRKVHAKKVNKGEPTIISIVEHFSPVTTTAGTFKTKSLIRKQGTSARVLRSRGFI